MLLDFGLPTGTPTVTVAPKSNIDRNAILGLTPSQYSGLQNVRDTGYYYGNNRMYEPYTVTYSPPSYYFGNMGFGGGSNRASGTIEVGDQAFRPVNVDIEGFSKSKIEDPDEGIYRYNPSMAYVYSNMPKQTYTPQQLNNVTSFLSAPTMPSNMYGGVSHGAGRFLNAGSLLPAIDYSAPQTTGSDA